MNSLTTFACGWTHAVWLEKGDIIDDHLVRTGDRDHACTNLFCNSSNSVGQNKVYEEPSNTQWKSRSTTSDSSTVRRCVVSWKSRSTTSDSSTVRRCVVSWKSRSMTSDSSTALCFWVFHVPVILLMRDNIVFCAIQEERRSCVNWTDRDIHAFQWI